MFVSAAAHHLAVHAPVDQVGTLADVDVTEGRVAVVAGAAQHVVLAAYAPWKQHAVAIVRQERIFEPRETLEVGGAGEADGRPIMPAAPGDVVLVLDLHDARVVGIVGDAHALFSSAGSENKKLIRIPGAGHNDLMLVGRQTYFDAVAEFCGVAPKPAPAAP